MFKLFIVVNSSPDLEIKREYLMIIFLLTETICWDPSSEASCQDGSDERSQHMVYAELTKIVPN